MNEPLKNDEYIKEYLQGIKPVEFDFDKAQEELDRLQRANINHSIHQEGPYLVCSSCERRHTVKYIGPGVSYKGFDEEGHIILEKRF